MAKKFCYREIERLFGKIPRLGILALWIQKTVTIPDLRISSLFFIIIYMEAFGLIL